MAGLLKEVWLNIIHEQFDQPINFLDEVEDLSAFVYEGAINFAEAGVDPAVLVNATSDIPVVVRNDTPIALPLDWYDTENVKLPNIEKLQLSYDKMSSLVRRMVQSLKNEFGKKASFNYSPSTNGQFTPLLPTTGAVSGGLKQITEQDILDLATRFDDIDAPQNRILVLHSRHYAELLKSSEILRNQQFYTGREGVIGNGVFNLYGFKIYKYRSFARYNRTTGAKVAYAAAPQASDAPSSFAFVSTEVCKAMGNTEIFERLNDPITRSDIFGFQSRFTALPLRNKYIGSIYSAA